MSGGTGANAGTRAGTGVDPGAALDSESLWQSLHDTARGHGPGAALARLYAALPEDTLPVGPAGHALVPAAAGRASARPWPPAGRAGTSRERGAEPMPGPPLTAGSGPGGRELIALRVPGRATGIAASSSPGYRAWLLALAWLRLGVSAGLLDAARAYLSARTVAGAPLLSRQLVRGALADAATELTARATLAGRHAAELPGALLAEVHWQITAADRTLSRLLGASGFTADGPGLAAYLSELLADTYVTR